MSTSMYQVSVPVLKRSFTNLIDILEKGAAYSESKKIDQALFLNSRLFPDMFPLRRQVQIATDIGRRGVARLAGQEAPSIEDNETSFAELVVRVQTVNQYLDTFTAAQIDGTEDKEISLKVGQQMMTFTGESYWQGFVLPNVYFHSTTTYNILRHLGAPLGKADFLGKV